MELPCRKKGYPHLFQWICWKMIWKNKPVFIVNRVLREQEAENGRRKKGFFKRLVSGLTKTRDNIVSGMDSIFNGFYTY